MIDLPGYKLTQELGRGGMARVYLALHEGLERHVAIKLMYPNLSIDPAFSERFLREARIIARLNHPNIIAIYDVNAHQGYHYIAMEYLPGDTLGDKISTGVTAAHALFLLKKLSTGLQFAHDKGFIHRDIKPENILFREDGTPVITDFGVARSERSNTKMTEIGTIIGTPQYMSPEQAQGFAIKANSDFYSLGIVFYEMLMGIVPYRADSFVGIMYKHVNEPIPTLPEKLKILQPLLDKLLAKDAKARYQSATEIIKDVERIELRLPPELETMIKPAPDPITGDAREKTRLRPETARRRRKSGKTRTGLAVLMTSVAAVVGVFIYFNWQSLQSGAAISVSSSAGITNKSGADKQQTGQAPAQNQHDTAEQAHVAKLKAEKARLAKQKAEKARQAALAKRQREAAEKTRLAKQKAEKARQAALAKRQRDAAEKTRLTKQKAEKARQAELAREQQILQLLKNGQAYLLQSKLQLAYQAYQKVLTLDQYNATAKTGLNNISDDYLKLAMQQAKANDFKLADQYLRNAQKITPTRPALTSTQQQIIALKDQYQNKLAEMSQSANKPIPKKTQPTPEKNDTDEASQQIFGGF